MVIQDILSIKVNIFFIIVFYIFAKVRYENKNVKHRLRYNYTAKRKRVIVICKTFLIKILFFYIIPQEKPKIKFFSLKCAR